MRGSIASPFDVMTRSRQVVGVSRRRENSGVLTGEGPNGIGWTETSWGSSAPGWSAWYSAIPGQLFHCSFAGVWAQASGATTNDRARLTRDINLPERRKSSPKPTKPV